MNSIPDFESFGRWVRRCRRQLDLTQAELGAKAGCSAAAIRKIEADERKPSRQLAELLARALEISDVEREAFLQMARGILTAPVSMPDSLNMSDASPNTKAGLLSSRHPSDNLPTPLTALVDRIRDTRAVCALLDNPAVRWVTLIGPPGIGKTRLSLQAGREALANFPSGAWFVDLAPLTEPGDALSAVIRSLVPFEIPPTSSLDHIAAFLKPHTLLLILDNFEHLTAAALIIVELLKRCQNMKVLATSRIPLQIYGEFEYRVPPLSIPPLEAASQPEILESYEAVQLFTLRVRQHQPTFAINAETAHAVVNICTRLEGIPLGLELAAANLKYMNLSKLAMMLGNLGEGEGEGDWIQSLSMSARDLPSRQQTLWNVVDWSYRLLNPSQQDLFSRLSIFLNWFGLDEVREICFLPAAHDLSDFLNLMKSLTDHSLLERHQENGNSRWRMLEIIREFASLHLDSALRTELEDQKASYYLKQLRFSRDQGNQEAGNHFFLTHTADLHASLDWLITNKHLNSAFQMGDQLEPFWWSQGYLREGLAFSRRLLAMEGEYSAETRAAWLENASDLAWQQHDFNSALDFSREAVEVGRQFQLIDHMPVYINRLGRIYLEQGNFPAARQVLTECLTLARNDPASLNPGIVLAQLGELALWEGDLDLSSQFLAEAITLLREEDAIFLAMSRVDQAELAIAQGKSGETIQYLLESRKYSHINTRRMVVHLLAVCGFLLTLEEDLEKLIPCAQLLGAIDGLVFRSGIHLSEYYQDIIKVREGAVRNRLSPAAWSQAFDEGRRWDKDHAWKKAAEMPGG